MCTKAAIINDALAMTIDPTRSPVEALPDYGEEPSILCYAQSEEEERTLTSTSCTGSPVTVAMGTLLPEGDAKIVQFATPLLIPQFHRPGSSPLHSSLDHQRLLYTPTTACCSQAPTFRHN